MSKKIALHIDCNGLGDTISSTPTLRKISNTYNQKISVFTSFPIVFKNNPYVDKIYHLDDFKKYKDRFDIIHNTFNNLLLVRNHLNVEYKHNMIDIRQYHAIATGFMLTPDEMTCEIYPDDYTEIEGLPENYALIHPTRTWPSRTWDEKNWQHLIDELEKLNIPVVAVGQDSQEHGFFNVSKPTFNVNIRKGINLINKLDLTQLFHVVERAKTVITMDSGILHIAGCTDTNIIQLGSSINPYYRAPYRNGSQDYKYKYIGGPCELFCASDMKYGLKEHGSIHGVPPIIQCLENKPTYECQPTVDQVINAIQGSSFSSKRMEGKELDVLRKTVNKLMSETPTTLRTKKRIIYLAPHLSTGGMPEFLRKRIEALNNDMEIKVVEWTFYGSAYVVQRNKIIDIIGEENLITLGYLNENEETYLANRMKLFDIIEDFQPDYIHIDELIENFDFQGVPRKVAEKLFNKNRTYKIFETLHTSRFDTSKMKWFPDKLFLVSDWFLDNFNVDVEKTSICYPIEKYPKQDRRKLLLELGLNPDYKHILNVGLFTSGKNQGYVFDVAEYLLSEKIQFHFIGNQASNFEHYWGPLMKNKPDNCVVWGERHDTDKFYAAMDLLIFPSLNEASPLVLKEALSHNMPILYNYLDVYGDDFQFDTVFELSMDAESDAGRLEAVLETTAIRPNANVPEKFTIDNWKNKHLNEYKGTTVSIKDSTRVTDKIVYSFLEGPKIEILGNDQETYVVKFIDATTENTVYGCVLKSNHWAACSIKYYKKWNLQVYKARFDPTGAYEQDGLKYSTGELVDAFILDLNNKNVYISFESKSIGDTIAWMPYVEEFREKHKCKIRCSTFHNNFFKKVYTDIEFIEPNTRIENVFAVYRIGWFTEDMDTNHKAPRNPEAVPLQQLGSDILGLDFKEIRPKIDFVPDKRPIPGKYVCIAHRSTANAKHWHYPKKNSMMGWQILVDKLKAMGYEVMVIQKEETPLKKIINQTGNQPLIKRLNQMYHAEFLIGVGSGLSWLNWAIGKKTVMISGFSEPWCEFQEDNIRVINKNVCHGCFNRYEFNRGCWDWCPVYNTQMLNDCPDMPQLFECTKNITPDDVIDAMIADSFDHSFYTIKSKDKKISLNKPNPDAYNESDAFIYKEIFTNKEYETQHCKINKGDVVVDLGANIGIFSRYAWMKGASKVFAFEPELNNYEVLCKNNPDSSNFNEAVSSYVGELELHLDSTVGGHSILEIDINKTRTGVLQPVKCRTLDVMFEEGLFDRIDFLKVDTEGAEIEIFKGISDENLLKVDKISMEYHNLVFNFDLDFRKEFLSRFAKLGFKVFIKTLNDHLQYIYMHQEN